jgi:hypothetical protein
MHLHVLHLISYLSVYDSCLIVRRSQASYPHSDVSGKYLKSNQYCVIPYPFQFKVPLLVSSTFFIDKLLKGYEITTFSHEETFALCYFGLWKLEFKFSPLWRCQRVYENTWSPNLYDHTWGWKYIWSSSCSIVKAENSLFSWYIMNTRSCHLY